MWQQVYLHDALIRHAREDWYVTFRNTSRARLGGE
jgi:ABC-type xylose transport system substrate-binding protein